jgi:hypothetical protein
MRGWLTRSILFVTIATAGPPIHGQVPPSRLLNTVPMHHALTAGSPQPGPTHDRSTA